LPAYSTASNSAVRWTVAERRRIPTNGRGAP
jgi:hypothetical protein